MSAARIPDYKRLIYRLNNDTGYYECTDRAPGFSKLPDELIVEDTYRQDIKTQAEQLIRSRQKNKKYSFYTGMLPSGIVGAYSGDHVEYVKVKGQFKKKNSMVVFFFSNDSSTMHLYYFNRYKVYRTRHRKFVVDLIRHLKNRNNAK